MRNWRPILQTRRRRHARSRPSEAGPLNEGPRKRGPLLLQLDDPIGMISTLTASAESEPNDLGRGSTRYWRASDSVLGGLHRPCPNDLSRGLGLEHHFLPGERVDALPRLRRWLFHHNELRKARQQKYSGLLEFLVADVCQRIHDVLHVALRKVS